jgi:cytochrome P450
MEQTKTIDSLKGPVSPYAFQIFQLIKNPLTTLSDWHQEFGSIFKIGKKTRQVICLSDPEAIKQIFTSDVEVIGYQQKSKIVKLMLSPESLIFLPEQEHLRQKRLVKPNLNSESFKQISQTIFSQTYQSLEEKAGKTKKIILRSVLKEISLKNIVEVLFNSSSISTKLKIQSTMAQLFHCFENPLLFGFFLFEPLQRPWGLWGDILILKVHLEELIIAEIEQRKKPIKENHYLDLLQSLINSSESSEKPLSNKEIFSLINTILFAGFESVAAAISWTLYWIHSQPNVLEKLLQEIDSVSDPSDEKLVTNLPYLEAVCYESLRITPPAVSTFARYVKKPVVIQGYNIPPGTELDISIYLTHHREDLYPESNRFKPERFLEKQFSPYEFIPFGGGECRCLGANLAIYQIKLVIFTIVKYFSLQLTSSQSVKAIRHGVVIIPDRNLTLKISQRNNYEFKN